MRAVKLVCLAFLLCVVVKPAYADSIVTNGGFETGNFTGWVQSGDNSQSFVWNAATANSFLVDQNGPHSETYAAYLGPANEGFLSQSLVTVPGQAYSFSYWLANLDCQPGLCAPGGNFFETLLNGNVIYSVTNGPSSPFTEHASTFVATGSTTQISFGFVNFPAFFALDDVSVAPVPEPSSFVLLGIGTLALAGLKLKRAIA